MRKHGPEITAKSGKMLGLKMGTFCERTIGGQRTMAIVGIWPAEGILE